MALHPQLIIVPFLVLCLSSQVLVVHSSSDYLTVPRSVFVTSLNSSIENVKGAKVLAVSFSVKGVGDFHFSNAISDCIELLDDSLDELISTRSILENPNDNVVKTGNPSSDIKTWLGDAMVNADTCIKRLESSHNFVHGTLLERFHQIRSEVKNVLGMVREVPSNCSGEGHENDIPRGKFPTWMDANVVVAKDGSGDYTTIMEAVANAPSKSKTRYVIHVKEGFYKQRVVIDKSKQNLVMIGDGMGKTIISWYRSFSGTGHRTKDTSTLEVNAWGFIARDMTIQNTAGPENNQAVALKSKADLCVFYRLVIRGYQDSLYANSLRQFYKECRIYGTVDFVFGYSKAVFQNCTLLARKSLPNKINTITAQARNTSEHYSAFSFQFCNISADEDLIASNYLNPTYLGRPWRSYSTTVFMQSHLSKVVKSEGWTSWNNSMPGSDTLFYGEYMNYGAGAVVDRRVNWRGFHIMNIAQARNFTVAELINGNCWLPSIGIDYIDGL